jgi:hypothetical protein
LADPKWKRRSSAPLPTSSECKKSDDDDDDDDDDADDDDDNNAPNRNEGMLTIATLKVS